MLIEHPELEARLRQILGGKISGQISVLSLRIDAGGIDAEIRMSFGPENIPPNFRKKSRNCLYFYLSAADFILDVAPLDDASLDGDKEFIGSNKMVVCLGRQNYRISAKLRPSGFHSVDEMLHTADMIEP
ncbi:MAG: hypothetical protein Q4G36_12005 [Paracoccus sp. (in: a-proteobacteria)]|nr:hypothetical protein [Paracoccus sp. (in: a-proteobacteria)]